MPQLLKLSTCQPQPSPSALNVYLSIEPSHLWGLGKSETSLRDRSLGGELPKNEGQIPPGKGPNRFKDYLFGIHMGLKTQVGPAFR